MNLHFKQIKEKVYSEINVSNLSVTKLYSFVLDLLGNEKETDSFMLDDKFGGFTPGELNIAKRRLLKGKNDLSFLNMNKKNINTSDCTSR